MISFSCETAYFFFAVFLIRGEVVGFHRVANIDLYIFFNNLRIRCNSKLYHFDKNIT